MARASFFPRYRTPFNQETIKALNEGNREVLTRFFKNNRHLRTVRGKSAQKQCNELKERFGFVTTKQTILRNENFNFQIQSLRYLSALSIYWGFSLLDMIVRDLESEGVQ